MTDTAARLREAAELVRKRAAEATPGPWRSHDTHLDGLAGHTATVLSSKSPHGVLRAWLPSMSSEPWNETRNVWADAAWIALMNPTVGEALAVLLEQAATGYQPGVLGNGLVVCPDCCEEAPCSHIRPALALADALLAAAPIEEPTP